MSANETQISERVIDYLMEISSGSCSITENRINSGPSIALREIMTGLLYLHEDLQFRDQQRRHFETGLIEEKERAEKASAAKTQFLAHMSHELRTPLNAILGFAQILNSGNNSNLTDDQKENIGEILTAGTHLYELIKELLDLSLIEEGNLKVTISDVDVMQVIETCIQVLRPQAQATCISLTSQPADHDCLVSADPTRLKQVLINLMTNAIKYNRENGKVMVHTSPASNHYLRISVTDTGPGLTREQISKVFNPFQRFNEHHYIDGAGIGLTISKLLINLMGGRIGVDSIPGNGSTFWLELARTDMK